MPATDPQVVHDFAETDIAIVGLSGRYPGANSTDAFWSNLREGVESLTTFDQAQLDAAGVSRRTQRDPSFVPKGYVLDEMELFDPGFFGLSPKEAAIMDPAHRHFLQCAWEAMEIAGHDPKRFHGAVGVYAGCGMNNHLITNLLSNPELVKSEGMFLLRHTGNDKDFLATRVSYHFDLTGPSVNVQTACSTSLVAIHVAVQSLLNGECDMALAGGATIKQPHRAGYTWEEGGVASPDGHVRAFDDGANGTAFGSGVGVVVLRRLADALEDGDTVHAIIKGSAINNDGSGKVGYLAPSVGRQAAAAAEAIEISGVEASSIGYVETHGTGTPVGDPIEILALTEAYRGAEPGSCAIGSLKTNIGHCDTAAGVLSVIKVVESLKHGEIPPSLNFRSPNSAIDWDASPFYLNAELQPWARKGNLPRRAAVNSLGVGGTNGHLILEEAPAPRSEPSADGPEILPISAKSATALDRASQGLADYLLGPVDAPLTDIAHTLQVGREAMANRRFVVASNRAEAAARLDAGDPRVAPTRTLSTDTAPTLAWMFSGGGAQFPNMGRDLYETQPVYRDVVDECLALLRRHVDFDLRPLLFPDHGDEESAAAELERPSRALPALFTTQIALARLFISWGIEPSALIGHSMGEYTAAHLADVFSLESGLRLVARRGELFETLDEGGMLSIPLPAAEVEPMLGADLSIAAANAPDLCVASGPVAAIDALAQRLDEMEIDSTRIRISVAAHSSMLEPILETFEEFVRSIDLSPPTLPVTSNVTGEWLTAEEATDPHYWVRHLRETVRFAECVGTLAREAGRVFVEVGPGRVLSTLARLHPAVPDRETVIQSMRHPGDEASSDLAESLAAVGRLWLNGFDVDWTRLRGDHMPRRIPLPTYPFEKQRCWIEPGRSGGRAVGDEPEKRLDVADWFYQPSWRRSMLPATESSGDSEDVLVFRGDPTLSDALVQSLVAAGHRVTEVTFNGRTGRLEEGHFLVSPSDPNSFETVLGTLVAEGRSPRRILYLPTVTGAPADPAMALGVSGIQTSAFYALLHLARAIGEIDLEGDVSLDIVSDGVHHVAGELVLIPEKSLLLGPARVIASEFPNIRCRNIDLVVAGPAKLAASSRAILREMFADSDDPVVAIRDGGRWVQSYEPAPTSNEVPLPVRDGGFYLITGGLGGIALEISRELASEGTTLALVSRSALPDRNQWDEYVASHGEDDRVRVRIEKVRELESQGARVAIIAADVTSGEDMARAVATIEAAAGPIHGVIHTAGVLEDELIQLKSPTSAARVLAPKVEGTLILHELFADRPLDFMVLFSSRSALTGIAGQVDYTSANAFLDAFAIARSRTAGPTLSINWSAWQEVGMAAELARSGAEERIDTPLFDRRSSGASGEERFSTDFALGRHWVLDDHRIRDGEALIPGAGYMELARAAFAYSRRDAAVEISDTFFVSPFVVRPDESRELRVELRENGDGLEFTVRGGAEGAWREHASGHIGAHTATAGRLSVDEIRRRCDLQREQFDAPRERAHLQLGERWNNLRALHFGHEEALAELALPDQFSEEVSGYGLHPALLDVATACAQPLIPDFDAERDFFIPASYGRLVLYAPLTARCVSHIRYRPSGSEEMAIFDVTIATESGDVLAEISEFVMMRLADNQLDEGSETGAEEVEMEVGGGEGSLAVDLEEAILPAEGRDAFRRALSLVGTASQLVISPQDLPALLEYRRAQRNGAGSGAGAGIGSDSRPPPEPAPDVEEALIEHPAVGEAVVLARQDQDTVRLVAYVVHADGEHATVSELRRFLRDRLAEDRVPQNYLDLDALPKDARGKVDLWALPDPFAPEDDYVAPRTETERTIARIWADLLGVERVSIYDNFLDIGGHSLLGLRAVTRISKKTGVRISPSALNLQTLEQIAASIEPAGESASSQTPEAVLTVEPIAANGNEEKPSGRRGAGRLFESVMQSIRS